MTKNTIKHVSAADVLAQALAKAPKKPAPKQVKSTLYKIVIQKLVPGKSKPKEIEAARHRRVIVVDAEIGTLDRGRMRETLRAVGAFNGDWMTDEIVDVIAVPEPFVILC
jgi:hypothetical protein